MSTLMVLIGMALLVESVALGGGEVGILMGILFMAAGVGRLYLLQRTRDD